MAEQDTGRRKRNEPRRTSRRSLAARLLAGTVIAVIGAGALVFAAVSLTAGLLFQPTVRSPETPAELVFEIRPHQTLRLVARELVSEGLARSAIALEAYGRLQGYETGLQAGRYVVSPAMSPVEILRKIRSGDAVFDEITITIPEGWSLDDIQRHFEERGLFTRDEFEAASVMQPAYRDFEILDGLEEGTILDGYLFPDTYRIFPDSTPESVVRRMLANLQRRVSGEILYDIEAQRRTLHEVLTLASIVQKEANDASQMPDVAGVFWNRLQIRMRLESDATVNYVLGTSRRQPTFADTAVVHPYNTYVIPGLPPGPIGNPGMDAIRATLFPASHDYLFFLHPIDGRIVLSHTFQEHLAAKARYLD